MKINKLIFILLCISFSSSAQTNTVEIKNDTTFYKLENGFITRCEKNVAEGFSSLSRSQDQGNQVIEIYYLATENLMAKYEINHINGNNSNNSVQVNIPMKNGNYEEWYLSGEKRVSCFYSNNHLTGVFKVFYRNGVIKRMELWENGEWKNGECYDENGNKTEYCSYQEMAEFIGGLPELYKYIGANLAYPKYAENRGIQGRVYVHFIVDTDGSIIDVEISKSVEKHLDDEALKLVNNMPKWKPSRSEGNLIKTEFTLPINFLLQK